MSSRVAALKPFSANTSSAASSRSERVCSRRRSRVQRSTMPTIVPRDPRNRFFFQIPTGIFSAMSVAERKGSGHERTVGRRIMPSPSQLSGANDLSSQAQLKVKPVKVWAAIGGAVLALQLYVWIRWITGPYFERVPAGPSDPPMYMKIPLDRERSRCLDRPAVRHLVVHHPALAAGAADHARRHADGVDGPDVLPGSAAELLQHLVHVQHLAVESGLLVVGHSRVGCRRSRRAIRWPNHC